MEILDQQLKLLEMLNANINVNVLRCQLYIAYVHVCAYAHRCDGALGVRHAVLLLDYITRQVIDSILFGTGR
jgi:hypothetical protein